MSNIKVVRGHDLKPGDKVVGFQRSNGGHSWPDAWECNPVVIRRVEDRAEGGYHVIRADVTTIHVYGGKPEEDPCTFNVLVEGPDLDDLVKKYEKAMQTEAVRRDALQDLRDDYDRLWEVRNTSAIGMEITLNGKIIRGAGISRARQLYGKPYVPGVLTIEEFEIAATEARRRVTAKVQASEAEEIRKDREQDRLALDDDFTDTCKDA